MAWMGEIGMLDTRRWCKEGKRLQIALSDWNFREAVDVRNVNEFEEKRNLKTKGDFRLNFPVKFIKISRYWASRNLLSFSLKHFCCS